MGLAAFEDDIKGVRNLIDLALSSSLSPPPHFLFPSSPAVVHSTCCPSRSPEFNLLLIPTDHPGPGSAPEVAAEVEMALGTGYGESKWICEEILAISRAETSLQPVIVRIGQVSGCVNGYWKPSEWIPSIIQSMGITGCLPSSGRVSKPPNMLTNRTDWPAFRAFIYFRLRPLPLRLWIYDHPRKSTCTYRTHVRPPGIW